MATDTAVLQQQIETDLVPVNLSDVGAFEALAALDRQGAPIEAQVTSTQDAEAFIASRYANRVARVCIDVSDVPSGWADGERVAIGAILRAGGATAPLRTI